MIISGRGGMTQEPMPTCKSEDGVFFPVGLGCGSSFRRRLFFFVIQQACLRRFAIQVACRGKHVEFEFCARLMSAVPAGFDTIRPVREVHYNLVAITVSSCLL